jgi:hypothetical protein
MPPHLPRRVYPHSIVDGKLPFDCFLRMVNTANCTWKQKGENVGNTLEHEKIYVRGASGWQSVEYRCCFCFNIHSTDFDPQNAGLYELTDPCFLTKGKVGVFTNKNMSTTDIVYRLRNPSFPLSDEEVKREKENTRYRRINNLHPWCEWKQEMADPLT